MNMIELFFGLSVQIFSSSFDDNLSMKDLRVYVGFKGSNFGLNLRMLTLRGFTQVFDFILKYQDSDFWTPRSILLVSSNFDRKWIMLTKDIEEDDILSSSP